MRLRLILTLEQGERIMAPVTGKSAVAGLLRVLPGHLEFGPEGTMLVLEEPLARQVLALALKEKRPPAVLREIAAVIAAKIAASEKQQMGLFEE